MNSTCTIRFEGLNFVRLVNSLAQCGIDVMNAHNCGKCCTVTVRYSSLRKTIAILQDKCYNISSIEYYGLCGITRKLLRHALLIALVVAVIPLTYVLSTLCWKVDVTGDYDQTQVMDCLSSCGVTVGKRIGNVDEIENKLARMLDANYAVIHRRGSVLYVNVIAKSCAVPKVDEVRNVLSPCEGVVASVCVMQGTSRVTVGDKVTVGTVLIEGVRTFNDGTTQPTYAVGDVAITVTKSGFAEYLPLVDTWCDTGNSTTKCVVRLLGAESSTCVPYEHYRTSSVVTKLSPLNIALDYVTYYEQTLQQLPVSLDECVEELKCVAYNKAISNFPYKVTEVEYIVTPSGVTAQVYGTVHVN